MSASLNVVALISGGKDSLYSILHCAQNGHKVVALANLHPKPHQLFADQGTNSNSRHNTTRGEVNEEEDDINSFMYQTVGHTIIPMYSIALDLPLYRRAISGSSVQIGRYYDASKPMEIETDETEDLVPLLQEVIRNHPEVNAISSGAILSTYQRTRIESIALRLGLIPLSFLWQYPALSPPPDRDESLTGLLDDMAAAKCDARIVKIASGGIKESLLNSDVAQWKTKSQMSSGLAKFFPGKEFWLRGAILGEGGEYETLAMNGPRQIWKKRIELEVGDPPLYNGTGGVSYLRILKANLLEQHQSSGEDNKADIVRTPAMLDSRFEKLQIGILNQYKELHFEIEVPPDEGLTNKSPRLPNRASFRCSYSQTRTHLSVNNIVASPTTQDTDAVNQMITIVDNLNKILNLISHDRVPFAPITTSNIVSSMLLLTSMSQFTAVNQVYNSLFLKGAPNPPARVTIACNLPHGIKVSLNVILVLGSREVRKGLHVQSRSYWAPANIGPYSQAICEPLEIIDSETVNIHDAGLTEAVHMAGQIPLIPHTMEIYQASFLEQAILGLQHLWRVGQERDIDFWPFGLAFLQKTESIEQKVKIAHRIWSNIHAMPNASDPNKNSKDESDDEESILDAWDLKYNFNTPKSISVGQHLHPLPNPSIVADSSTTMVSTPPFIAAEVSSLPRQAPIEWWSLGLANVSNLKSSNQILPWGSITGYTYHHQQQCDDNNEGKTTNFLTIRINDNDNNNSLISSDKESTYPTNPLHLPVSINEIINSFLSNITDSEQNQIRQRKHEIIHGTAFISEPLTEAEGGGSGWDMWSELSTSQSNSNSSSDFTGTSNSLALIPCRNLFGSPGSSISTSITATTIMEDTPISTLQRLAIAIVVRVDTY